MGQTNGNVDNSNVQNQSSSKKVALPLISRTLSVPEINNENKIPLNTHVTKNGNSLSVYVVYWMEKAKKGTIRPVFLFTEKDEPIASAQYVLNEDFIDIGIINRYADYTNLDQALLEFVWRESLNEKRYGLPKIQVHNYAEMLFYYQLGFRVSAKSDQYCLWGERFEASLEQLCEVNDTPDKLSKALENFEVDGVSYKNTIIPFVRNKLNLANDVEVSLKMVGKHGFFGSYNDALTEGIDFSGCMSTKDKNNMPASFEMYPSIEACVLPSLNFNAAKENENENSHQVYSENVNQLENLSLENKKLQEALQQQKEEFNQKLIELKQLNLQNPKNKDIDRERITLQTKVQNLQQQLSNSVSTIEQQVLNGKQLAEKVFDLEKERDQLKKEFAHTKTEAQQLSQLTLSVSETKKQLQDLQYQKQAEEMLRTNLTRCIDRLNDYVKKYNVHNKRENTFWHKHGEKGRVRATAHYSKWELTQYKELTESLNTKLKARNGQPFDANALQTIFSEVMQQLHDNALNELKSLEGGNWHEHSYRTSGLIAYSKEMDELKNNPNALTVDFSALFSVLKDVNEAEVKAVRESLHL